MNKKYFTCRRVHFYANKDEDVFFEWIKKIPCIESFEGARDELYLDLYDRDLTEDDIIDLIALFYRYKIEMGQLAPFITKENRRAFIPWKKKIFGKDLSAAKKSFGL